MDFGAPGGPRAPPTSPPTRFAKNFSAGYAHFPKNERLSSVFVDFRDFGEIEKCKLLLKMAVFGSGLGPRAGDPGLGPGRAPGGTRAGPGGTRAGPLPFGVALPWPSHGFAMPWLAMPWLAMACHGSGPIQNLPKSTLINFAWRGEGKGDSSSFLKLDATDICWGGGVYSVSYPGGGT